VLVLSGACLAAIVLTFFLAPLIAPYGPNAQGVGLPLTGPSAAHWFGTDELGRDLFTRVLYGGRLSVVISSAATAIAMALGCLWGVVAAMRGKWLDEVLMRSADIVMATPQILLALICVAAFGASEVGLIVIIGFVLSPVTARMARSVVLTEMARDYYLAAIAYGASRGRLARREILPNARRALGVQATIVAANAIILEASLSFVGLGIQPPAQSLGSLLQEGYQFLYQSVTYSIFPAIIILVLIWLLTVFADQLDPAGRA
jgi:peptide/nickel transport system permease protein